MPKNGHMFKPKPGRLSTLYIDNGSMPIIFFLFMETLSCPRCKRVLDAVMDEFSVPKTDFFFFFFVENTLKNKKTVKTKPRPRETLV